MDATSVFSFNYNFNAAKQKTTLTTTAKQQSGTEWLAARGETQLEGNIKGWQGGGLVVTVVEPCVNSSSMWPACLGLSLCDQGWCMENHLNTDKTQHIYKHKVKVRWKIAFLKTNPPSWTIYYEILKQLKVKHNQYFKWRQGDKLNYFRKLRNLNSGERSDCPRTPSPGGALTQSFPPVRFLLEGSRRESLKNNNNYYTVLRIYNKGSSRLKIM